MSPFPIQVWLKSAHATGLGAAAAMRRQHIECIMPGIAHCGWTQHELGVISEALIGSFNMPGALCGGN
jgi:hypothetical protein